MRVHVCERERNKQKGKKGKACFRVFLCQYSDILKSEKYLYTFCW